MSMDAQAAQPLAKMQALILLEERLRVAA